MSQKRSVVIPVTEKLPPPRQPVIVVCPSFRCLGWRDEEDVWHYEDGAKIEEEPTGWHPIEG